MTDHILKFIHISDTHLTPDMGYTSRYATCHPMKGMEALIEQINALPFTPDFVLHTGDVAYDPVPEVYGFVKEVLSRLKFPVYYVTGNHDHSETLQRVLMGRTETQRYLYYEFEVNGVQIVVVDSNGPAKIPAGYVTPEQLAWLEKICAAADDRPLVVAVHHNIVKVGIPWLDEFMATTNGDAFHQVVAKARHRLRGVFHGHIHQNVDVMQDGVLYASAASSWTQFTGYPTPASTDITPDTMAPPGYSIVTLTRSRTYIRRHTFHVRE